MARKVSVLSRVGEEGKRWAEIRFCRGEERKKVDPGKRTIASLANR